MNEDSARDKLGPTIGYLQKLGPQYLPQIFDAARWVFEADRDMAFEVRYEVLTKALGLLLTRFLHLKRPSFPGKKSPIFLRQLIRLFAFAT